MSQSCYVLENSKPSSIRYDQYIGAKKCANLKYIFYCIQETFGFVIISLREILSNSGSDDSVFCTHLRTTFLPIGFVGVLQKHVFLEMPFYKQKAVLTIKKLQTVFQNLKSLLNQSLLGQRWSVIRSYETIEAGYYRTHRTVVLVPAFTGWS